VSALEVLDARCQLASRQAQRFVEKIALHNVAKQTARLTLSRERAVTENNTGR
jgi:hypothetical protein